VNLGQLLVSHYLSALTAWNPLNFSSASNTRLNPIFFLF
jgi:hypothetical protein